MNDICHFNDALPKTTANHAALSPLSFLKRAAAVYPDKTALIYNELHHSWLQTYARCCRQACMLRDFGITKGDTVAVMLPNVPAMYEAHFGVPMVGAVLNAINVRLDPEAVAFILDHSRARLFLVDPEYADVVDKALARLKGPAPTIINVSDTSQEKERFIGELEYEALLAQQPELNDWQLPADEWDAIALGYTSGTTGNPKGVVTHHRGAYLNAVSNVLSWTLPAEVVYLWTLPMFHCNGWCFPWTMAAIGGTNVCLRRVDPVVILDLIKRHGVSHYCGAPVVHAMIADAAVAAQEPFDHKVSGLIAGAAPPASVLERMEKLGVELTHVYGLTETYGPASVCVKQNGWEQCSLEERVRLNGRQGVAYPLQESMAVLDPATLKPVPADGETVGEIMFRGNIVMKGYLRNEAATSEAFSGGWFHSGDLAVVEADGYIKIRDRLKDVIISGGENISSLEVEDIIQRHGDVEVAAVVAMADAKWGEVPAAFVQLRPGSELTEEALIDFCKENMSRFKAPKKVIFGPLPTTSTGKIQKFQLRQRLETNVTA
ncbi:acyl-CoA synthetase [Halomonas sp. MCCC 1A17488]|uniref:acyl-CoA synthetase n=1 Tax=unclassified Halomonas TaxID=2609666 RepID=UPI0018D24A22|nr:MULTISPECIES: acyl-CoA synthetase [unclassified Halomonas]MCE8017719.1 acyl-CoA synthetase [Halomonas sp. MCCC 1A17488]MCG3241052.1 acyl-CoA synthetase [Halomonas sp. MCCC 1A17488]QPP48915.1 acyl-CoA synthetase [Halomonas sp. SS10-MC5]